MMPRGDERMNDAVFAYLDTNHAKLCGKHRNALEKTADDFNKQDTVWQRVAREAEDPAERLDKEWEGAADLEFMELVDACEAYLS